MHTLGRTPSDNTFVLTFLKVSKLVRIANWG